MAAGAGAVAFEGENLGLLDGVLDIDEMAELTKAKATYQEAIQRANTRRAGVAGQVRRVAGAPGSSGDVAGPPRALTPARPIAHVVDEAVDYNATTLKRLLPQTKGCTVSIDNLWHNRIVVAYPRKAAPFTKSCVFGPSSKEKHTVSTAFIVCAKWAWLAHYEVTGEACPYEI